MSAGRRYFVKIRKWLWLPAIVLAFVAGSLSRDGSGDAPGAMTSTEQEAATPASWTCSMHPQIVLPSNDQQCPICFMDLIPVDTSGGSQLAPDALSLSEAAVALAEIETTPVERRFVERPVRLTGKVAVAEDNLRSVTARFGGRLDRLYVSVTGQYVEAGAKLADIYSPDLYMAQVELLAAADSGNPGLVRAARQRLRLWGLDPEQIDDIIGHGEAREHLSVTAPLGGTVIERRATTGDYIATGALLYTIADLSTVWVTFDALESDAPLLRPGQSVEFTTRALPGQPFGGDIRFVEPVLREATRSVEVRVAVDNPDGLLRPGMLVAGTAQVRLDENGQPADDEVPSPLVIPASAPLLTGERAVVYVRQLSGGEPVFVGRQVRLGPRAGDVFIVAEGLSEGEDVVSRGNFKIDSALQILARPSMMNPGEDTATAAADEQPVDLEAPACFRTRLAEIFERYVELQMALAGDDEAAARRAAADLREKLNNVACGSEHLPPESAAVWTSLHSHMTAALGGGSAGADLAGYRATFESLSDNLWRALVAFTDADQAPARRFHCPMAFDNAGAHWLQLDEQIANPYFGASMLRCGTEVAIRTEGAS